MNKDTCVCVRHIIALLLVVFSIAGQAQIWLLPLYVKLKMEETRLEFYGKVIDQNGDPVPDATVNYSLSYVGLIKPTYSERKCKTDAEGKFTLKGGTIAQLYFDSIERTGYVGFEGDTVFEFQSGYTKCHKADKEKPVVFRMRKKNKEAVFLRGAGFDLEIFPQEGKEWVGYDMSHGWDITPKRLKNHKDDNDLYSDFELSGTFDKENQKWTVTLKTNGENSGFILSDERLFEAPESGYVKEKTMEFSTATPNEAEKNFPKYIYARIREPGFYMRAKLGCVFIDPKRFTIQTRYGVFNPYGGRCLEDLEIPENHERWDLEEAADKALKYQKFMEQPDFEQWIKEGKAIY